MKPIKPPITARGFKEVVYAENQPEYISLPGLKSKDAQGVLITAWSLSFKERLKLLFGTPLYLLLLTFNHPLQPVRLSVGYDKDEEDEAGEKVVVP